MQNKKGLLVFVFGVLAVAVTVGAVLVVRTYLASADTSSEPKEIKAGRVSPTAGEITFATDKEAIASIECATSETGPFSICGAETEKTTDHKIKTSIILDPEKAYHFKIKIGRRTYDNIGLPFVLPKHGDISREVGRSFPASLLGACQGDPDFDADYDLNKDGCIRQNDWDIFGR